MRMHERHSVFDPLTHVNGRYIHHHASQSFVVPVLIAFLACGSDVAESKHVNPEIWNIAHMYSCPQAHGLSDKWGVLWLKFYPPHEGSVYPGARGPA